MSHKAPVILSAKLQPPSIPSCLLARPHLLTRLQQNAHDTVVLVTAPAAYGKTTLIASWLNCQQTDPVAWFSLDEADNDAACFLAHLTAALSKVIGFGPQPEIDNEHLLAWLLNQASAYAALFTLVLDNYQAIKNNAIHAILQQFLDYKPSCLRIVLLSRCLPLLDWAQLRMQHQLCHLQTADLRLTHKAITAYLTEVAHITLPYTVIVSLDEMVQGWLGGWQMITAVFGMNVSQYQLGFTEPLYHLVFDYFISEIWSTCPLRVRDMLLVTAVPDQLSAPLCAALCPQFSHPGFLNELANDQYFLTAVDDHHYQYHPLFRTFLRKQLQEHRSAKQIKDMHRQACQWFQTNGGIQQALSHALATQDDELIVPLLEEAAWHAWQAGHSRQLREWLAQLPESTMATQPRLCLYQAWELSSAGQYQRASERLQQATALIQKSHDEDLHHMLAVFTTMLQFRLTPHNLPTMAKSSQNLQQLPPQAHHWQTLACIALGGSAQIAGEPIVAQDAFYQALDSSRRSQSRYLMTLTYYNLINDHVLNGRLHQAKRICQQLQAFASQAPMPNLCQALAEQFLGKLNLYQNRQRAAAHHLQTALQLCQELKIYGLQPGILEHISWLKLIMDDLDGAFLVTEQLMALVRPKSSKPWLAHEALIALKLQNWPRVDHWLRQITLQLYPQNSTYQVNQYGDYFTLLLIYLTKGRKSDLSKMQEIISFLRRQTRIQANARHQAHLNSLEACLSHLQGDTIRAAVALQKALDFAQNETYILPFLLIGSPIPSLLVATDYHGLHQPFVQTLLDALPQIPSPKPLVDQLSPREQEILQLVAGGFSNQQIGQALVITPNTVKTHLKRINIKLQTNNRAAAVAVAQTLNLL